jgi:hypothetical protein
LGGNKIDESAWERSLLYQSQPSPKQEKNGDERVVKEEDGMKKNSKPNNEKLA